MMRVEDTSLEDGRVEDNSLQDREGRRHHILEDGEGEGYLA